MSSADRQGWACGALFCTSAPCGYQSDEDVHVWAIGSEPVECPECGAHSCVPYCYEESRHA